MTVDDTDDTYSLTSSRQRSLSKTPSTRSFPTKHTVQETVKPVSAKVTESHFSGHTRLLAIASKTQVRYNMIFKNIHDATGPNRLEFAWDAIKDAAKKTNNRKIDAALQQAVGDVALKKQLITFVCLITRIFQIMITSFL